MFLDSLKHTQTGIEIDQYNQVIEKIAPHSRLLRSWPLKGGISAGMTALEIERLDGQAQKLVVRRPGNGTLTAEDEFRLLQTAQSLGLPAPIPVALDSSGEIFPVSYLVTGYIEGKMDFAPVNPWVYAEQLAAHLARIHSVDSARADLSFLPRQPGDIDGILGACPRAVDPSWEGERIRNTLENAWPFSAGKPGALLHGDFWPGNILWQGDRLAAVIDWEDARVGDPLSDLAVSRLDLLWIIGPEAMHAFTRHYQARMALDDTHLPYWDLCAALRLVRLAGADLAGWADYFHPYGRRDITAGTIREHYRYFISQAYEKLAQR